MCTRLFYPSRLRFQHFFWLHLGALQVCDMLDRLYLKFDEIALDLDVFKLETIGDAYMAVANLVCDQSDDHAVRIALFALRAQQVANSTLIDQEDTSKGCVSIRIGICSGPVVAHVVGSSRPKYTIFGTTINTASRMESTCLPGRVQCSRLTALLVAKQRQMEVDRAGMVSRWGLDCFVSDRGMMEIKGMKGLHATFWISAEVADLQLADPRASRPPL